jgi:dTDP-4-dehydrorhamnose reductase
MHILIFGRGFLGSKYQELLGARHHVSISRVDICSPEVEKEILYFNPDVIINCAAKSGRPNIDWCETHKLETLRSNLQGPLNLLQICSKMQKYWVQLGSGCIYEGDNGGQGFSEEDQPNFFRSYYSQLKAQLNELLKPYPVLQLRLRMPLDEHPGPRNLISKLVSYPKIISLPNSVTFIDDMVVATEALITQRVTGIFNVVNPEPLTQHDILTAYQRIVDPNHTYETISLAELERTLTRAGRSNCILSTKKLESHGVVLPNSHQKLEEVLQKYKENL